MKLIIVFSLLFSINSFGQLIEKQTYIDITRVILSDSTLTTNLIEFSDFDSHPVYNINRVIILDTTYYDKELIYNSDTPSFIVCSINEIESSYINYWMYISDITRKKNKIDYKYRTQSLQERDSVNYIQGHIRLKRIEGKWIIEQSNYNNYEFWLPLKYDCYGEALDCKSYYKRPKKSIINNPFFGDWQYLNDSSYFEIYCTDDSLFFYNEFGPSLNDYKYTLTDSTFIIFHSNGNKVTRQYKILAKDKIKVYGDYITIWDNDTTILNDEFVMERISKFKYRYSDIKCWGKYNKSSKCYIDSKDAIKYQKAFIKRHWKYKSDKWKYN